MNAERLLKEKGGRVMLDFQALTDAVGLVSAMIFGFSVLNDKKMTSFQSHNAKKKVQ